MLDSGARINEVQKRAGHCSLSSTGRYLVVSDAVASRVFQSFSRKLLMVDSQFVARLRPLLRLLPGGAIQFPGRAFIPLWTSAFHVAL